ncbi:hypothetical protein CC78DRAFT_573527 [Lojkania enalia]|uniref:Heterokaryon incompatibility domain-containing protein n=1 Tax=Lojkania enalia TaxID=147567 RepID=A0A9P4TS92_9PLEO|nr:hypothetical protein CC78DRAFT_573527 [Didymosphaeria enalia]
MAMRDASTQTEATGPLVQFARFDNGKLRLFSAHTHELRYFAISHVWGDIGWRKIPGIDGEFLVSAQKVDFIVNQLPDLVGDTPFWMDTLTVDQRNQAEVIATVQNIPAIFRDAGKTIAVRENDGFYACCADAIRDARSIEEFRNQMFEHCEIHKDHVQEETYLKRLWTLQEILLSDTVQFVAIRGGNMDPIRPFSRMISTIHPLEVLGASFFENISFDCVLVFSKAYVMQEVILRLPAPLRTRRDSIYNDLFPMVHAASNRRASKPRDYIFATMPQFPWYHYPKNAERMEFGDIFLDYWEQASKNGFLSACKMKASMIEPQVRRDLGKSWLPSEIQPEPACLGDFLKLLGGQLPGKSAHTGTNIHVTRPVCISPFEYDHPSDIIEFIARMTQRSHFRFCLSCSTGEIPKDQGLKNIPWENNLKDINMLDWLQDVLGQNQSVLPFDSQAGNEIFSNDMRSQGASQANHFHPDELEVARDYLYTIFFYKNANPTEDNAWWPGVRDSLCRLFEIAPASHRLLPILLLMTATICCGMPVSATAWLMRFFIPIHVQFGEISHIGLLARHENLQGHPTPRTMLCVGQHLPVAPLLAGEGLHETFFPIPRRHDPKRNVCFGQELVLIDPEDRAPIGLLPDILHADMDEHELWTNIKILYDEIAEDGIRIVPLSDL